MPALSRESFYLHRGVECIREFGTHRASMLHLCAGGGEIQWEIQGSGCFLWGSAENN